MVKNGGKTNLLDEDYMKQALRLARKGLGRTSPNPMVGAIIVKDDQIMGKGYHRSYGLSRKIPAVFHSE